MIKLLASSVIRGSNRGDSHGGVYLVDLHRRSVDLKLDWKKSDIDWRGAGADRGLRGIAVDGEIVYIASSDELFAFSQGFELIESWRTPFLKHCHEIMIRERSLFLTSTGFDAILEFDLEKRRFEKAIRIESQDGGFGTTVFGLDDQEGPAPQNALHLNSVYGDATGIYTSGMKSRSMLCICGDAIVMTVDLPPGTHNARPFRGGVLFNDTNADMLRYCGHDDGGHDRAMAVPAYDARALRHTDLDDGRIARQGFARGLCVLSETLVAGGSSPSTVTIWDVENGARLASVNLTMDIRSAIHCLVEWPF